MMSTPKSFREVGSKTSFRSLAHPPAFGPWPIRHSGRDNDALLAPGAAPDDHQIVSVGFDRLSLGEYSARPRTAKKTNTGRKETFSARFQPPMNGRSLSRPARPRT